MSDADESRNPGANVAVPPIAAVCGLYCEACSVYIASHEDPNRLAGIAARFGWSVEDTYCDGCRSDRRTTYCRVCNLCTCAAGRGLSFCNECAEFPCAELAEFQRERPHRAELYTDLDRLAEVGVETWLVEARERYSCPACRTLNSAYDLKCRSCGREPASEYVAAHKAAIVEALSRP